MKRSHSFRCRGICKNSGSVVDILTVFFARTPTDITILTDEVQNALNTSDPIPDILYIVAADSIAIALAALWKANQAQADILLERGNPPGVAAIKDFSILGFKDGEFSSHSASSVASPYQISIEVVLQSGLALLVKKNSAYQIAPPGHVFSHPSGKKSKNFFLASELLRDEIDVYFVAMCICAQVWSTVNKASKIYIDTMGIYPIAKALESVLICCGRDPNRSFEIENFHSHRGFDAFQPVDHELDIALISASTSGGLAKKLHEDKQFRPRNIITLLDTQRQERVGWIIHSNDDYAAENNSTLESVAEQQETPIELAGEYFVAQGKRPRELTLTIKHAPASLQPILDSFHKEKNCVLNGIREDKLSIDVLSFNAQEIVACEIFVKWLTKDVKFRTPASVSHIIFAGDVASQTMATRCVEALNSLLGKKVKILSASELSTLVDEDVTGVLVCSAIVGNGHLLRIIARELREVAPSASRHFAIALALPDSRESWDRLKQFLTQSGEPSKPYLLSCWRQLAVGRKHPEDSWARYSALMQKLDHASYRSTSGWPKETIENSLVAASALIEVARGSFLPASNGMALRLTDGFVYWKAKGVDLSEINHEAVSYLAISSTVQNAREFDNANQRLKSTLHEAVILDPENFLRFNDGVLQAALLRSTYSYEVNYSMNLSASQSMREIMEKIFLNNESKYGEAALEFGVALASGHIQLTKKDSEELFRRVGILGSKTSALSGLLYFWWSNLGQ
ncbi:MAG: hypothetical protein EON54_08250 [Alcaligenaceae bacterium]|nr:MAG: hypothetical protein EON54_08250 [Alcaligenaceae bacterium]